jgi:hypothetical protein
MLSRRFPRTPCRDCSGTFEVANNSLASASVLLEREGRSRERLETTGGAVLEMVV